MSKKNEITRFEDNYDQIVKHYFDETGKHELSQVLKDQLVRWKFVRMVYSSWRVALKREVVNALMREFKIDEATAYRDIANAQRLFVRLEEVNREFERIIRIDEIKQLRVKAIGKGDLKTAAECDKSLIKIGGYDQELKPAPIVNIIKNELVFDPRLVDGEEIPNLEKVVASFITKKKKQLENVEDADIIEEELKNGGS